MKEMKEAPVINPTDVRVVTRGDIGEKHKLHACEQVAEIARHVRDPILFASVKLTLTNNPANERPAVARATLDVNGQPVHAVASAATVLEAVDRLHERLRHQVEHLTERRLARRVRGPESVHPGEWRHGDRPADRPAHFPRPRHERQVVRHTTFALEPLAVAEAADQLNVLGYDFHLFHDVGTDRDSIVERVSLRDVRVRWIPGGDGSADCIPPVPTLTVDEAIGHLDLSGQRWVFFRDGDTLRGAVVYLRYDGHYGLVVTADTT